VTVVNGTGELLVIVLNAPTPPGAGITKRRGHNKILGWREGVESHPTEESSSKLPPIWIALLIKGILGSGLSMKEQVLNAQASSLPML
jgi:hypothetical protein